MLNNKTSPFQTLVDIVSTLRGPNGCPWDKEQTHSSLTQYAIEETAELVEAIESKNDIHIKEELGDVLFQVVLHSQLAKEESRFEINSVIENLNEKLIRRHPHVFGSAKVDGVEEVLANWEAIKQNEKGTAPTEFSLNVPVHLPALQRAHKIGKRTEKFKFDWQEPLQVVEKVKEELDEVVSAMNKNNLKEIKEEIGDLLFSVAQLARHLDLEPEQCLREGNRKFERRFETMIKITKNEGRDFLSLSDQEKEELWSKAKGTK